MGEPLAEDRKTGQLPAEKGEAMSALLTREGTQPSTTEPTAPAGPGPLRRACHRIRLTIQEMNYAARRAVELQAPWSVDQQWQRR